MIHRRDDRARSEADAAPDGPFRGVPILVKDLDGSLALEPLHLGNRLLREVGYTADHDSYLFARLRAAGCVIVGKTNTPELGLLPTTESHAYGAAHNPWDVTRSPGGSSGGSAAAVASGMVPFAHAGDGGGSIRIPASACGLFGLKPTRGRVSLGPDTGEAWAGLVARHVVSRSVRDSAAALDAIAGAVPGDPYAAAPPDRPFAVEVGADPGRLRIGILAAASPAGLAAGGSRRAPQPPTTSRSCSRAQDTPSSPRTRTRSTTSPCSCTSRPCSRPAPRTTCARWARWSGVTSDPTTSSP